MGIKSDMEIADKGNFLECWVSVATSLFSQALLGGPVLREALQENEQTGFFGFTATISGEEEGKFSVMLDRKLLDAKLLGEDTDQTAGWSELLLEIASTAAGELLARTGRRCQILAFGNMEGERKSSSTFELQGSDNSWSIQIDDEVRLAPSALREEASQAAPPFATAATESDVRRSIKGSKPAAQRRSGNPAGASMDGISPGLELLLDVELEASLRFGAREMPLGEILDLGPGDVVQLDRHISDPVDLIVGDKIVARGEVVLVNGNFGLRVTQVAEPQSRLESIRCLF
jgi:flagellar motor switch protein FliN